jgi:signal transduction histidine kinase
MPIAILGLVAGAVLLWLGWRRAAKADQANRALRAAERKAVEERDAVSQLLAMAGHDLRQPLQALTLHISLLDPHLQSETGRELLDTMDGVVQSMTQLVAALVALTRLEDGGLTIDETNFALGELLKDVAALCGGAGEHDKISIRAAPTTRVRADPDMLEIILSCLACHVLAHSKTGRATLDARPLDGQVSIDVHGAEIDEADGRPSGHTDGAAGLEGANFSLSVVWRLAQRLGYPLSVQSLPGGREVFRILLPAGAG